LLPTGTKTWSNRNTETTIDLILATQKLGERKIKRQIHQENHGSDHQAIETHLDTQCEETERKPRLLFKNAPWKKITEAIKMDLDNQPRGESTQEQLDINMGAVMKWVTKLTPNAKPSPYAKRWWTADLTQLRKFYKYWRNTAATQRRMGRPIQELEDQKRRAAKEYHTVLRKQRKTHWEEFLREEDNIWKAARYLDPEKSNGFARIPQLQTQEGRRTETREETAKILLETFPPLPGELEEETNIRTTKAMECPTLNVDEIQKAICSMNQWKAPGEDGLPVAVWVNTWPATKDRILRLFQTSLEKGELPHQWRNAKIIPLKKSGKDDYTKAKA
jgi:hypothetical protein